MCKLAEGKLCPIVQGFNEGVEQYGLQYWTPWHSSNDFHQPLITTLNKLCLAIQPGFDTPHNSLLYTKFARWRMPWKTMSKALLKSIKSPFVAFPSSTKRVTSLSRVSTLVKHDFPFIKPSWLLSLTFLSSMCLETVSRISCSTTFPWTEASLTSL